MLQAVAAHPALALQDRSLLPEDLQPPNPKRVRIGHASVEGASKLSPAFGSHSARERQLLAAAAAFKQRWVAQASAAGQACSRLAPMVTMLNEAGTEKVVCTSLRPACLPHSQLYDLRGIAQVGGWPCRGLEGRR